MPAAIGRAREEHFSKEAKERQKRKPADSVPPNSAEQTGAETRDLAAAEAGFKRTSYSDASKVVDSGDEEVIEIMDSGQASVSFAASLVDEDEDTKTKVVEKIKAGVKPVQARREVKKESLPEVVIPDGKYRVIYSDPPWKYGDTRDGLTGYSAAADHYPDMSIKELCELDIKSIAADDAVLFMWVTSPLLYEAAPIIGAWGFKYKAAYVWDKVKHNVGHYVSVRHEILLICTRGSCTPDDKTLHDSVVSIERTGHSRKPEYFRELIDKMYTHGPKLEMFRRGDAPEGWEVWGNQADD